MLGLFSFNGSVAKETLDITLKLINKTNCESFLFLNEMFKLKQRETFAWNGNTLLLKQNDIPFCHVFHKGCDEGYFGTKCNQVCGYCKSTVDCYHVNGSCLSGCKSGYIGDKCNSRKCVKAV